MMETINRSVQWGPLLLRLMLAGYWIAHLGFKVVYRGMPATEQFFMKNGLPAWLAWFDISLELGFVACLLAGVLLWPVALLATPILIASILIYMGNGFYFPSGGIEFPLMWLILQYVQALVGPGNYSAKFPLSTLFVPRRS